MLTSDVSPLTVWVGSTRYVFRPGRDVFVGFDRQCDVRLDSLGAAPKQSHPALVLRFTGTNWVAIDRSRRGIFVNGATLSTVDIHDGQAITLGDPRGPRLFFQITTGPGQPGPPKSPSAPAPPIPPPQPRPAKRRPRVEPGTGRLPSTGRQYSNMERPTRPFRLSPRRSAKPIPVQVPNPGGGQPKSRGLVERMTDATRKLIAARPAAGPGDVKASTNRLPLKPGARTTGVEVYRLGLTVDGHQLLSDVSFTARPGALMAVIGPSPARNCALIGLLAGTRPTSSGKITVDGHDTRAEPESMRSRISEVPRDDRIHPDLTVEQAVGYAAEMRLPSNTSPDNRRRVVNQVLDELELTPHRKTRVTKLSPDVRRCASMAIELITRPSLLVVDEPGAGLDPKQEVHVMTMLRRQADLGCVIVVATTSLDHLNMCDEVLVLTTAGTMAFAGPPMHIESAMGTADWSEIFARVSADPHGAHRGFLSRQQASPTAPEVAASEKLPPELTLRQQIRLVARRQASLLLADHIYFLFLAVLPFALGALALLIPGYAGLDRDQSGTGNPHEAVEILAALNIGAVIMGTSLTVRELVKERHIFRREQALGLSTLAYLVGKIIVFGAVAAIQSAILTTIVILTQGRPEHGAVLLQNADFELYVSVAVTAIVSAIIGLALSTLGNSQQEVLPLAVPVVLTSGLFAGGFISLVGTWGYDQISWFIPAQWGFAASASTVDLRRVDTLADENAVWAHYAGWWVFDMLMLVIMGVLWAGLVLYRLRSPHREIRGSSLHSAQ